MSLPSVMVPSAMPPPPGTGSFKFTVYLRGVLTLLLALSSERPATQMARLDVVDADGQKRTDGEEREQSEEARANRLKEPSGHSGVASSRQVPQAAAKRFCHLRLARSCRRVMVHFAPLVLRNATRCQSELRLDRRV